MIRYTNGTGAIMNLEYDGNKVALADTEFIDKQATNADLDKLANTVSGFTRTVMGEETAGGSHTVTTAEDAAGTLDIVTGLTTIDSFHLTIINSSDVHLPVNDAVLTKSGGTITVADGSTKKAVATEVIYWSAVGS